jgi:hypothetical protein
MLTQEQMQTLADEHTVLVEEDRQCGQTQGGQVNVGQCMSYDDDTEDNDDVRFYYF